VQSFFETWAIVWSVIGVIVVGLFIVEFALPYVKTLSRLIRYKDTQKPDYRSHAECYDNVEWAVQYFAEFWGYAKVDWAPFVQWRHRPFKAAYLTVEDDGNRRTVQANATENDNRPKIHAYGGSTMFGMGARDDWTIASLLSCDLAENAQNVEVVNKGQIGHTSTQELIALIQNIKAGDIPDVAVFYDGINEIITAEQTGKPDRLFNEHNRVEEFNILLLDRRPELIRKGLATMVPRTLRRLRGVGSLLGFSGPAPRDIPVFTSNEVEPLSDEIIHVYRENVRIIQQLADTWGFKVLFFWQPAIFSKKTLSDHEARYQFDGLTRPEIRHPFFSAVYEKRRSDAVLKNQGNVIDISSVLDEVAECSYIDSFHTSEGANQLITSAMVPAVLNALKRTKS
jgi:hypothetical protein